MALDFADHENATPSVIDGDHRAREAFYAWCRRIHGPIVTALGSLPVLDQQIDGLVAGAEIGAPESTVEGIVRSSFNGTIDGATAVTTFVLSARGDVVLWHDGRSVHWRGASATDTVASLERPDWNVLAVVKSVEFTALYLVDGGAMVAISFDRATSRELGSTSEFTILPTRLCVTRAQQLIGLAADGALVVERIESPPGWGEDRRLVDLDLSEDDGGMYLAAIARPPSPHDDQRVEALELLLAKRIDGEWHESEAATVYPERPLSTPLRVHVERRTGHRDPEVAIVGGTGAIRMGWKQRLPNRRSLHDG